MKRTSFFILAALMAILCSGCCVGAGLDSSSPFVTLFKFNQGEDLSSHLWVGWDGKLIEPETPPVALDSGYFLFDFLVAQDRIKYLCFTYDDWRSHRLPEDWQDHWQEYVIAESPFEDIFSVWTGDCHGRNLDHFPAYCPTCENTFFCDTSILNQMIAEGKFNNRQPFDVIYE
jgi:hypothetical protein